MARDRKRAPLVRVLCIPHYCVYAHACPVKGPRQRYVLRRECFRYRPPGQRPLPRLSACARELLAELRAEEAASAPAAD